MDDLPLPEGTRLLHIGPQKTGTSGLQAAFHTARRGLAEQGVHYAGSNRQPRKAAIAAASGVGSARAHDRAATGGHWRRLLRDVRASTAARVLISSEEFADAEPAAIRRLVADLDPGRVHVVVTVRPLDRILPSQWQQLVQGGLTLTYAEWLANVFDEPSSGAAKLFWHRHRHHDLIARWAAVVGAGNVTAVVVDDRDPRSVLRSFEQLLGLRDGTLVPVLEDANRSLTRSEVELVRAAHAALRQAGVDANLRHDLVTRGAAASMKLRAPSPDEPRVSIPMAMGDRVLAASRDIADGIHSSGVRVLGNIESLARGTAARREVDDRAAAESWPAIEAHALLGVLHQTGRTRRGQGQVTAPWPDTGRPQTGMSRVGPGRKPADLGPWSIPRIASHLVGRLKGAARGLRGSGRATTIVGKEKGPADRQGSI